MTVASTINKVSYTAAGSQTVFAYTFKIYVDADLKVYVNGILKTLTTDYTVSDAGVSTGGNVTFGTGLTASDVVVIERVLTLTQGTDYVENDPFPAETHEAALDRLTFITQQHQDALDRSIKFATTVTDAGDVEVLDSATSRANKLFAFDSAGDLDATQEIGVYKNGWTTATVYVARDIIKDTNNNNIYLCNTAHTSSGALPISSNADTAKWDLIVDAITAASSASAAAASAAAALVSENNAQSSEDDAAADLVLTNADVVLTHADVVLTHADVVLTNADVVSTAADRVATNQDAIDTAADLVATNQDTIDTAADLVLTNADVVLTNADVSTAAGSASTATTQAGIATTKAGEASTSATSASGSATTATTQAGIATTQATTATTQATNAATSATNAATSETNAAASATTAAGYVPSATGHSGEYLTTDGTTNSWASVDALPTQTGNAGKYLTTDATTASWATLSTALVSDTTPQLGGTLDCNGFAIDFGNWTITETTGVLYFATGGVNKMKLDASGNLTVVGDVTASGTI